MPPILPALLTTFVDEVVPILQKRGLFRREYAGRTLREHYGLARPESQFFAPAAGKTPPERSRFQSRLSGTNENPGAARRRGRKSLPKRTTHISSYLPSFHS